MKSIELLSGLKFDVEQIIATTESRFSNLPELILNRKENSKSWSILECYEHLNRYSRYYNTAIAKRLTRSQSVVEVEVKSTWLGRKSIESMHPSNTKKQRTLRHLDPANSTLSPTVITEFLQHQKDLLSLLETARHADINKIKVPVEFLKILSLTLGEAFQFIVAHEQRHFLQLERTLTKAMQNRDAVLVV